MAITIRVKDWRKHFEVADNRKCKGPLRWVAMPTRHDTGGWRRLCSLPNSVEVALGFMLIVEIAAKMPIRGVLADTDIVDEKELAIKTGMPIRIYRDAFAALTEPSLRIKWLEWVEVEWNTKTIDDHETQQLKVVRTIPDGEIPSIIRTHPEAVGYRTDSTGQTVQDNCARSSSFPSTAHPDETQSNPDDDPQKRKPLFEDEQPENGSPGNGHTDRLNAEDSTRRVMFRMLAAFGIERNCGPVDQGHVISMLNRGGEDLTRECLRIALAQGSRRPCSFALTTMENKLAKDFVSATSASDENAKLADEMWEKLHGGDRK